MIPLRYLTNCTLEKITKVIQANGAEIETYAEIGSFNINIQEINDSISASIYGSSINRMIRIISPNHVLEDCLYLKVNTTGDNITNYVIKYNNLRYKIVTIKKSGVDIELIDSVNTSPVSI